MPKQTPSNERNRIPQYRLAAGLSQSELAEKSGIGLSTLTHYESVLFMGRIPVRIQASIAKSFNRPAKQNETVFLLLGDIYLINSAASKNGEAAFVESKGASFPIWAETQVIAAHAFAHAGRYHEAQRIAYTARDAKPGPDPDMWIGKATNPRTIYAFFDIIANLAAQRNYEAVQAAESTLANLDKEQPENLQWRVHIQTMQATALWELGAVDDAALMATDSLRNTRTIGSVINESRIEGLHQKMRKSVYAKHPLVRGLGEMIMSR